MYLSLRQDQSSHRNRPKVDMLVRTINGVEFGTLESALPGDNGQEDRLKIALTLKGFMDTASQRWDLDGVRFIGFHTQGSRTIVFFMTKNRIEFENI